MSQFDDMCSVAFQKEWRMFWARAFIKAWLEDPRMQDFPGSYLDDLTTQANDWIQKSKSIRQIVPIVSSEDLKESGLKILRGEAPQ
jgi:hypothetical protein